MLKQHPIAIYVVHFSDGRIKFGLTGNIESRMHAYKQEALRNGVAHMVWWSCKPLHCRADARVVENEMRRAFRSFAICGHREWLRGVTFECVMSAAEDLRTQIAKVYGEDAEAVPFQGRTGSFATGAVHA